MRLTTVCASLLSLATVSFASQSVASVTSGGVIGLSGTQIDAGTVPSWPLVVGDEIRTFNSSAVIVFSDKSRVLLGKNSTATIGVQNGRMVLNMVKGDALGLRHNAALVTMSQGKRVDLAQANTMAYQKSGFDFTSSEEKKNVENKDNAQLPGAPAKPPVLSASKP